MLDSTNSPLPRPPQSQDRPIFRMMTNDRMGGSVPAWIRPSSVQDATLSRFSRMDNTAPGQEVFAGEMALAYQADNHQAAHNINEEPFNFGDLVDIVNPLHHIPLVGHLYRQITGDQIRPSSSILGGALFGGALGAAGGMANLIIKEESGRDVTEHAMNLVNPQPQESPTLQRLANAGQAAPLPGSALSFIDMAYRAPMPETTAAIPAPTPSRVAALYRFND